MGTGGKLLNPGRKLSPAPRVSQSCRRRMWRPPQLANVIPNNKQHALPSSNSVHLTQEKGSKHICCASRALAAQSSFSGCQGGLSGNKHTGQHKGTSWFLRCKSASARAAPSPLLSQLPWHFGLPGKPCWRSTGEKMKGSSLFMGQVPPALLHWREFTARVK